MSKVLMIGAGGVGAVVAQKCAQVPEVFSELCIASRTLSKCDDIAAEIKNIPVTTRQVDADNVPTEAIRSGVSLNVKVESIVDAVWRVSANVVGHA